MFIRIALIAGMLLVWTPAHALMAGPAHSVLDRSTTHDVVSSTPAPKRSPRHVHTGVDLSYTHFVDSNIPSTIGPDSGYRSATLDYRAALTAHMRWGRWLMAIEPYALGAGQAPDVAGMIVSAGFRLGAWTLSIGHESRHNLDRPTPGFDGRHPAYNLNWMRLGAEFGARRNWRLW